MKTKQAKHTPGPWIVTSNGPEENLYLYGKQDNSGQEIACIPYTPRNEINAHLIAASPEMYEQLKLVQAYLKARGTVWTGIDEVLNKAEGKES